MTPAGAPDDGLLESALTPALGGGAPVAVLERRPLPYRSTYPLEALRVRLADGAERRLVFKDSSRRARHESAWRVKPPLVRDPRREIETYRDVLAATGLSTPAFLGACVEPALGRYWLFLEQIDGDLLWQMGAREVWRRAARWLAAMHARFSRDHAGLPARLLRYGAAYYRRWLVRARRFARRSPARREAGELDALARPFGRALAWLAEQPVTLLHGEFYPSNVLVEGGAGQARIRPVDWEMAGIGPGLLDLAALAAGWDRDHRDDLAAAYHAALPRPIRPPASELRHGLDQCDVLLATQWLGWSARWSPPPEHARDWLATALEIGGSR